MFTKIRDKSCKVIVGSKSCINAISSRLCENHELEIVPHPLPSNVSWIDSTALMVKQQCLVPDNFTHYKDKIWCDVIIINVGEVILGKPWLFDKNVTTYDRSNMCQFEHEQIKLLYLRPKTGQPKKTSTLALLPTPPYPPLIAIVHSLSPINHAYPVRKLLPYC